MTFSLFSGFSGKAQIDEMQLARATRRGSEPHEKNSFQDGKNDDADEKKRRWDIQADWKDGCTKGGRIKKRAHKRTVVFDVSSYNS